MRILKLTYFWVFLIVFINGKAHSDLKFFEPKKAVVAKSADSKVCNSITQETPDDDSPSKRKRKPRGIEVAVPHISNISFEQSYTYQPFEPLWIERIYSFIEYHIHGKRGPPLG